VNAWTEIACIGMLMYLVVVIRLFSTKLEFYGFPYPVNLLLFVPVSFTFAMVVTLMTKPVDKEKLIAFYKRVQPGGPGWRDIEAEVRKEDPTFKPKSPLTMANVRVFLLSVATIYCFLFGIGKTIIGNSLYPEPVFTSVHLGWVALFLGLYFLLFGLPRTNTAANGNKTGIIAGVICILVWILLATGLVPLPFVNLFNRGFGILLLLLGLFFGYLVAQSFSSRRWKE
jgi:hypothetical protein